MSPFHPEELKKLDLVGHLEELRKRILISLAVLILASIAAFFRSDMIMGVVKGPASGILTELIFIGPTEGFVAYLKICLIAGFVVSFPVVLFNVWAFVRPALSGKLKGRFFLWFLLALLLFAGGVLFSYFWALPAALRFLVGFGSRIASPYITLGKYVSFFGALILIGGMVFEVPIVMVFATDAGFVSPAYLSKRRPYAYLVIMIIAAIITPTQDIVNMLIFAVPMIILYEAGLVLSRLIERKKKVVF